MGHEIKTKYSIDETVWFIHENKITSNKVLEVKVKLQNNTPTRAVFIRYVFQNPDNRLKTFKKYQSHCFPSKEELIKELAKD